MIRIRSAAGECDDDGDHHYQKDGCTTFFLDTQADMAVPRKGDADSRHVAILQSKRIRCDRIKEVSSA
jgi:hypothetical protein